MTEWGASIAFDSSSFVISGLRMRVDAFDGTNVRGALFGVFDVPVMGAASAVPAQITNEVQFDFPFRIQ